MGQEVINHDGSAVQHDHKILILTVNSPLSSGSGDAPPLAATSKAGFPDRCFLPLTLVAEVEVTDNPRTTRLWMAIINLISLTVGWQSIRVMCASGDRLLDSKALSKIFSDGFVNYQANISAFADLNFSFYRVIQLRSILMISVVINESPCGDNIKEQGYENPLRRTSAVGWCRNFITKLPSGCSTEPRFRKERIINSFYKRRKLVFQIYAKKAK